jgi:hypothetical protein
MARATPYPLRPCVGVCVKMRQNNRVSFGMPALVRAEWSPLCRLNPQQATVTMVAGAGVEAEMAVAKFQFEPSVFCLFQDANFVLGNLEMKKA